MFTLTLTSWLAWIAEITSASDQNGDGMPLPPPRGSAIADGHGMPLPPPR